MRTFALLIVSGATAFLNAAQSAPPKRADQPFSISITLLSTEVRAGAEIDLKTRLTNTSQREMGPRGVFYAQGLDMSYRYDCRDESGKSVAKEIFAMGSLGEVPALRPGESREGNAEISNACDLSRPGKYEIQVSRPIPDDPQHRVVKSNKITVTIIPPLFQTPSPPPPK
jgi:hypothetical protein